MEGSRRDSGYVSDYTEHEDAPLIQNERESSDEDMSSSVVLEDSQPDTYTLIQDLGKMMEIRLQNIQAGILKIINNTSCIYEKVTDAAEDKPRNENCDSLNKAEIIKRYDGLIFIKGNRKDYGRIVGKGGWNVHNLQHNYDTSILVPLPGDDKFDLIVIHNMTSMKKANQCALKIVDMLNANTN